ncbi:hypothetical protein J6590_090832 [Homalodisca vitripennis]|nr:hypothetical protein J6590_090832 [Homalodisca vitripennis]
MILNRYEPGTDMIQNQCDPGEAECKPIGLTILGPGRAAEETTPTLVGQDARCPLSNEALEEMKRRMRTVLQRWRGRRMEERRMEYVEERIRYVQGIRKAKREYCERKMEEGEEDSWGHAYKIIGAKLKKEVLLGGVMKEDGRMDWSTSEETGCAGNVASTRHRDTCSWNVRRTKKREVR